MIVELTIIDAVKEILKEPAPILFPDTCSLVDIIRLPMRAKDAKFSKKVLEPAAKILSSARHSPKKLWIVIAPPISTEWLEHSVNTKNELIRHFIKIDKDIDKIHFIAGNRSISLGIQNNYENCKVDEALFTLSEELLNSGLFLLQDPDCVISASNKTIKEIAPAKKGKSHKDSMIAEHIFLICDELNKNGFNEKMVFLTSNTEDFCELGSKIKPRPPLDVEFSLRGLELTTNWNLAAYLLGI